LQKAAAFSIKSGAKTFAPLERVALKQRGPSLHPALGGCFVFDRLEDLAATYSPVP
jgi:hypothetical protein